MNFLLFTTSQKLHGTFKVMQMEEGVLKVIQQRDADMDEDVKAVEEKEIPNTGGNEVREA